jgi:tetratricopeptide (TPR) repeat protein
MDVPAFLRLSPAFAAAAAILVGAAVRADELQEAGKLLGAHQHQQALERVNKVLSTQPNDPRARFLQGLIYADQGNAAAAIDVFQKLTVDYPELPEPYNNLAVIYASQGQYDKARAALEQSIRTHPSYATAYENLGDVYAKLASEAYDKALKLDSANAGAQSKLALVRDLFGGAPGVTHQASPATPSPAAAPQVSAASRAAPAAKAVIVAAPQHAAAADTEGALDAVTAWADAWSRKDVDAYLGAYAREFRPPGGETRSAWESQRRERLTAPKSISVKVDAARIKAGDDGRAHVTFRQHYRSDLYTSSNTKTLLLSRSEDGRWRIVQERAGQ